MSAENVEFLRARLPEEADMVDLFGGDISGFAEAFRLSPDFEAVFISNNPDANVPTFKGAEGLAEGWQDWLMPYESYRLRVEDYTDAGDDVVIRVRVKARTGRDGVLIEHTAAAAWTIKDGCLLRVRFYLDPGDAPGADG